MIELTAGGLRTIFPQAPQPVIDAFLARQDELTRRGVNSTRQRLAYFLANIEHESNGFTIRNLTENINYSAPRAAQIWPSRFHSAAQVTAKYGSGPGWQLKMFDDVYGNRMGNQPGTHDGSHYIGRGGPQITGRDGYREVGKRACLPLEQSPELATRPENQPALCAAFWDWKKLNSLADVGDFKGLVKRWNGGAIGMEDRLARLHGNERPIAALPDAERIKAITKDLPGQPPTALPPRDVVDDATKAERKTRTIGAGAAGTGAAGEATNAGTQQPDKPAAPLIPSMATYTLIGVGLAVVVVAFILIARKKAIVTANWN